MRDHTTGIQWFEKFPDLMPGKMFFSCERLSAHITFETCRQNHEAAHQRMNDETPLRLLKCRECSVGRSLHADSDAPATWQDVRRSTECLRCGRRDLRLIPSAGICVSCWNRRRETERGFNARGRPMLTPINLHPRRVGLLVDGKPAWRAFSAYHEGEAISRAVAAVDGAKFHDRQPGKVVWNPRVKQHQYRCDVHTGEFGTLVARQSDDGTVEYICPVCTPGRAKGLSEASVCGTTSLSSPEFVQELAMGAELSDAWLSTSHVCDRCCHYPVQVRRFAGKTQARCPLCDAQH